MTVEFFPGYYEWNLYINNKLYYTFDDITESVNERCSDSQDVLDFVNDLIYLIETEKETEFVGNVRDTLDNVIFSSICNYFDIH